jgi:hypothetical protein
MSAPSLSDVVNIGGTLLSAAGAAKSIFTPTPKAPKLEMPEPSKPVTMPTTDDDAVKKARVAAVNRRQAASGRQSTILRDEETLG